MSLFKIASLYPIPGQLTPVYNQPNAVFSAYILILPSYLHPILSSSPFLLHFPIKISNRFSTKINIHHKERQLLYLHIREIYTNLHVVTSHTILF